jgi:hypothetical protein
MWHDTERFLHSSDFVGHFRAEFSIAKYPVLQILSQSHFDTQAKGDLIDLPAQFLIPITLEHWSDSYSVAVA